MSTYLLKWFCCFDECFPLFLGHIEDLRISCSPGKEAKKGKDERSLC